MIGSSCIFNMKRIHRLAVLTYSLYNKVETDDCIVRFDDPPLDYSNWPKKDLSYNVCPSKHFSLRAVSTVVIFWIPNFYIWQVLNWVSGAHLKSLKEITVDIYLVFHAGYPTGRVVSVRCHSNYIPCLPNYRWVL